MSTTTREAVLRRDLPSTGKLKRRSPQHLTATQQHHRDLSIGSNDSSSATLTSIVTIAKFPPQSSSSSLHTSRSLSLSSTPQQQPSIQSLSAVTTICGSNGSAVITTTASAPNTGRVKRTSKFSPLAADAFNCDPLLNAAQERRSTEIIL
ncbi:hypothetical protein DOY81_007500 [Sarcophaga bullata]|nr:hypothetical protein DOY81_007500 [Sarcophaga bullata]